MAKIKLIGTVIGQPTPHDGRWLKHYDPSDCLVTDRIVLETTDREDEARTFSIGIEAIECWRTAVGFRPDGKPNRPLTAWTVEIH